MLDTATVKAWINSKGGLASSGAVLASSDLSQLKYYMQLIGILPSKVDYAINHSDIIAVVNLENPAYAFGATKQPPVTLKNPGYIKDKLDEV